MKRSWWILALVFLSVGCASVDAIHKNYNMLVDAKDGVDEQEAKIIAQKKILNTIEQRDYRITAPDIKATAEALKYPDYWFVVFGHNWFSPMSTDTMAKTYKELRQAQFVVVIAKADGTIKFLGQWYPKRQADFDWVFEPEGYKRKNPLALPPYYSSTELF